MSAAAVSSLLVAAALPGMVAAQSQRVEVRLELLANRVDGRAASCEVVQALGAGSSHSFVSWGTLDGTGAQCGAGSLPASSRAPALIVDVSADVGWSSGAMDPGPVGALQVFLTLNARQHTGTASAKDHRTVRLEPGEEFVMPVPVEASGRAALGVHDVLVRVRAAWAAREGATEYGTLAVLDAAPSSEIVLDGGVAGRVGTDGTSRISGVPAGQREVRLRGMAGHVVVRNVPVIAGRTVVVAPRSEFQDAPRRSVATATGKNSEGFQEFQRARDGAPMIEIPEGEFLMGNLEIEGSPLPHTVHVSSYLMDELPLTVARFKRFAAATGRPLPPDPYWGVHDDFPVAFVRWDEAKAYCEWAGARLPTEAEREKAARGTDGRMFPWGSEPPDNTRAVFGRTWGQEGNDAVGTRPSGASPYGLLDSEGNMWEFCEDWWDPDYYASSPRTDPQGPTTGVARVVRGGSWDSRWAALYASRRNFAYTGYREGDFGFRCASDLPR